MDLGAIGAATTPPTAKSTKAAREEAAFFSSEKKKRGHMRDQRSRDVLHYGAVAIVIAAEVCVLGGIFTWGAHQIFPTEWCWLDEKHVGKIADAGSFLLSGVVGALGIKFLTRNIEPE